MTAEQNEQFILLVEDNDSVREALVWALESSGYKVITVSDGQNALRLLENDPLPMMIFLDLMMPVIDGFEFRKIKKLNPRTINIPTVIVSAKANLEQIQKMSNEWYLPKPFELHDLLNVIKKILRFNLDKRESFSLNV